MKTSAYTVKPEMDQKTKWILSARRLAFLVLILAATPAMAAPATSLPTATLAAAAPAASPTAIVPNLAAISPKTDETPVNVAAIDHDRILTLAGAALVLEPVTITKFRAKFSDGTANDFYSTGDTWWPDPKSPDGLPYFQRPNHPNPNNFNEHRKSVMQLRDNVAALAAAYKITGNDRYVTVAAEWLRVFFVDPATRMNPSLRYAQSVPGVATGRSYGVDDVLPLIEIPAAVKVLQQSPAFPPAVLNGFKKWSADYVDWLMSSTNGDQVAEQGDSHTVIYWLQIAVFADVLGDNDCLSICRTRFKFFLLPNQIAANGSFTRAATHAKTYSSVLSQSENLAVLCYVLSTPEDDLWHFMTSNGRNIRQSIDYLYPYLEDRSRWPSSRHSSHDGSPTPRESNLLFAGLAYHEPKYLELWKNLSPDIANDDARRNCAVTQPVLWVR